MPLQLFKRIRRHAAISTGNFDALFKKITIAPIPVALAKLLEEINKTDADIDKISQLISSLPEISAQVIKTVNSSLYSLRSPVLSVQHAVSMLGLAHIRTLSLSFAAVKAAPKPAVELFDTQAFWTDSLIRALVARCFAKHYCPDQSEEAFTSMLIADVALPVLLTSWAEYYESVINEWLTSDKRLSELEQQHFGWSHAQAGAWILNHWKFPEEMICFVGIHNSSPECIDELQLNDTIALPLIIASLLPSCLHEKNGRPDLFVQEAQRCFSLSRDDLLSIIEEAEQGFDDIHQIMGICQVGSQPVLEAIKTSLSKVETEEEAEAETV